MSSASVSVLCPSWASRSFRASFPLWWLGCVLLLCALWIGIAPTQVQAQVPGQRLQLQWGSTAPATPSERASTPHVQAQLVLQAPEGIAPGAPATLGVLLQHQPDWHTYWKNPGDSGLPTQLTWTLPPGLSAGAVQWPVPQQIRVGDLLNYGYEGTVLLPVPLQVAPDFVPDAAGQVQIGLHASWLVCRVECIPEEVQLQLQVPAAQSHAAFNTEFIAANARQPSVLSQLDAQMTVLPSGDRVALRVAGLPASAHGQELAWYPEAPDTLRHAAVLGQDWQQRWDGAVWHAELPLSEMRGTTPEALDLVLGLPVAGASVAEQPPAQAWRVRVPIQGQWQAAQQASMSPALAAALAANAEAAPDPVAVGAAAGAAPAAPSVLGASVWMALVGGVLGGLLLNLMPCVFPVLAIKLLSLARHGDNLRAQRLGGLAYTAGTVLSFVALGALLLALRAAGEQLGWGFQLQNPMVVAALALLFTVLGLNLAGVFEFGQMLPSALASAHLRHPVAEAWWSGVLAVAVASPCTAPFMGASLGMAIALPTAQALAIFAALGVGMALPYLLLCWAPGLVRWLPRPGPWMATFRRAMAFPMLATVVWLAWVLGQQTGVDGIAALLALLLLAAALVWALTLSGRTRWGLVALLLALLAWAAPMLWPYLDAPPAPGQRADVAAPPEQNAQALWQPWSAQRQAQWLEQGQPVFVDYTAAWCVTCQYNKRTTLSDPQVLQAFAQRGVHLLRADWTRRDPEITAALNALGRSGVPVYVLLSPGRSPQVLTELIDADEVLEALARI